MSQSLSPSRFTPQAITALRVVTGLLFIGHGLVKLAGFPEGAQPGMQPLLSLFGIGAVIEVVTGALVVLGLFTRPAAFVASGQMAVAYFMFHAPSSFYPVLNGGEPAILFTFIFLLLSTTGAGAYSLDGLRAARQRLAHA
ncbi:MAG: DoxX family protein [Phenylobacterium sp. RIFCSPHIGHO2_01_FULL_69_31]|jgi:putative oxidoreductase|uniref:DoxX family protein n=1 Tax=Phenylobacterium sp. RIFCSPHIGHO2_01_FULL_69_31 TaxID=1801944 RepID=UPI0008C54249|nr:DoxX family protein [Phenylobacterium sp. RIFCSPHIGHO2_01_FULL_69_31]OHB31392.1 MAG: DoxX family protein [Phenylobacterium sp. RIFCSPHIGHO2_01_FULL_69_31]